MRNDYAIDEIKREIKKLQSKSSNKTILFIVLGIIIIGLIAVLFILKCKDKLYVTDDDFDDDECVIYGDDEDDNYDFYEDYRALDYDDEE